MGVRSCLIGVMLACTLALGVGVTATAQEQEEATAEVEQGAGVEQPSEEAATEVLPPEVPAEEAPAEALPAPAEAPQEEGAPAVEEEVGWEEPSEEVAPEAAPMEMTEEEMPARDAAATPAVQPAEERSFTPYPYWVIVMGDAVNIRSGPTTKAGVIGRAVRDESLEVLGQQEGWLRVVIPSGAVGYIYAKLTGKPPSSVPAEVEAAVEGHLREGNVRYYQEDFDGAIEEYRAALDAWPESIDAHYNLASAYADKGWYDEAINEYAEVLALKLDHANSLFNLGWVYFQQGKYQDAAAQWERVTQMRPWFLDALYNLALALEMAGDPRSGETWQRFIQSAEQAGELREVVEQVKGHLAAPSPQ